MHTDGKVHMRLSLGSNFQFLAQFKILSGSFTAPHKQNTSLILENSQFLCYRIKLQTRTRNVNAKLPDFSTAGYVFILHIYSDKPNSKMKANHFESVPSPNHYV